MDLEIKNDLNLVEDLPCDLLNKNMKITEQEVKEHGSLILKVKFYLINICS